MKKLLIVCLFLGYSIMMGVTNQYATQRYAAKGYKKSLIRAFSVQSAIFWPIYWPMEVGEYLVTRE